MNARYYDPEIGIFMCPDPSMQGTNHYEYAKCNPIMYSDPTGLDANGHSYSFTKTITETVYHTFTYTEYIEETMHDSYYDSDGNYCTDTYTRTVAVTKTKIIPKITSRTETEWIKTSNGSDLSSNKEPRATGESGKSVNYWDFPNYKSSPNNGGDKLVAQKDFKDKIGDACSIVGAYDAEIIKGGIHDKSDIEVVATIYDQKEIKGDWSIVNSLNRIFGNNYEYVPPSYDKISREDLNKRLKEVDGFAITQFKQLDLYQKEFGNPFHWLGFVDNKYIDPHNKKQYNTINELQKDRGFPVNKTTFEDVQKVHIFRRKIK